MALNLLLATVSVFMLNPFGKSSSLLFHIFPYLRTIIDPDETQVIRKSNHIFFFLIRLEQILYLNLLAILHCSIVVQCRLKAARHVSKKNKKNLK